MTEDIPQHGLLYTAELDDSKINPHLEDFRKPEDPIKRPPYGGDDTLLLEGERLWLYALPLQRKLQIRLNDVGPWCEPSTEAMVSHYLEKDDRFGTRDAPGEPPSRVTELWDELRNTFAPLPQQDRDLVERGAELAADPDTYYQQLGELCYRNR